MNIKQVRNMTFMNKIRFLFYGLDYVEYKIKKTRAEQDARRKSLDETAIAN